MCLKQIVQLRTSGDCFSFWCKNVFKGEKFVVFLRLEILVCGKEIKSPTYILIVWENFGMELFCWHGKCLKCDHLEQVSLYLDSPLLSQEVMFENHSMRDTKYLHTEEITYD